MSEHTRLSALEEAHDREASAARERIEQADQHILYYRTQMIRMQEHFYAVAQAAAVQDAPEFQFELRRVTGQIDENVVAATRVLIRFDEELTEMTTRHGREHEDLRKRLRQASAG